MKITEYTEIRRVPLLHKLPNQGKFKAKFEGIPIEGVFIKDEEGKYSEFYFEGNYHDFINDKNLYIVDEEDKIEGKDYNLVLIVYSQTEMNQIPFNLSHIYKIDESVEKVMTIDGDVVKFKEGYIEVGYMTIENHFIRKMYEKLID